MDHWFFGTPFILLGIVIGILIGATGNEGDFHREAIRHHAAHYDTNTGNFTWNHEAE